MKTLLRSLLLSLALTVSTASAQAIVVNNANVPGNANIYNITGAGQGTSPYILTFANPGRMVLTMSSVTGTVSGINGATPPNGPDGHVNGANFVIAGANNMSGITDQTTLFLAGAFLGPTQPAVAPPALNFGAGGPLGISFSSLSPQLGQVFFIGDGLTGTGTGTTQQFFVPTGATRLFLGIVDSCGGVFPGPGCYGDNQRAFTASFRIQPIPAVPELETWALMVIGLGLILAVVRKKAR